MRSTEGCWAQVGLGSAGVLVGTHPVLHLGCACPPVACFALGQLIVGLGSAAAQTPGGPYQVQLPAAGG